jgi:hypothetical protein
MEIPRKNLLDEKVEVTRMRKLVRNNKKGGGGECRESFLSSEALWE